MGASDLILGGFGEGLGGVLRGSGEGFVGVLVDLGRIWIFSIGTPALPRSAPRSVTIGSAGRITGQTVPGSTVQRQPLQQCAKASSENRVLFFEMPPSIKILKM